MIQRLLMEGLMVEFCDAAKGWGDPFGTFDIVNDKLVATRRGVSIIDDGSYGDDDISYRQARHFARITANRLSEWPNLLTRQ